MVRGQLIKLESRMNGPCMPIRVEASICVFIKVITISLQVIIVGIIIQSFLLATKRGSSVVCRGVIVSSFVYPRVLLPSIPYPSTVHICFFVVDRTHLLPLVCPANPT